MTGRRFVDLSVPPWAFFPGVRNLEALPPNGFEVSCFPVTIHTASAG